MSRLPTKILRIEGFRLKMAHAAVLLSATGPLVAQRFRHMQAQAFLAAWLGGEYFRKHAFRPRADEFTGIVSELMKAGYLDEMGHLSSQGSLAFAAITKVMLPALSPREWVDQRQKYLPTRSYVA